MVSSVDVDGPVDQRAIDQGTSSPVSDLHPSSWPVPVAFIVDLESLIDPPAIDQETLPSSSSVSDLPPSSSPIPVAPSVESPIDQLAIDQEPVKALHVYILIETVLTMSTAIVEICAYTSSFNRYRCSSNSKSSTLHFL